MSSIKLEISRLSVCVEKELTCNPKYDSFPNLLSKIMTENIDIRMKMIKQYKLSELINIYTELEKESGFLKVKIINSLIG